MPKPVTMNRTISYLFIIISAVVPISHTAAPLAGPFEAILKRGGSCPNVAIPKNGITFESKIVKHTRKYSTVEANVTIGVTVSDDIKAVVTLSRMSNQGWKDNFLTIDAGAACTSAKRFLPTLAKDVLRSLNKADCPIPPGYYPNISLDLNITVGLDTMIYNDYKGRVTAKLKGELVFCAEFFVSIVPKKPGRH